MPETSEKPRWLYRLDNYKRAFSLLREAIETMEQRNLTQLEKEGIIQRFEYTWELAWKLIKDYVEYEGIVLEKVTPASAIRAALEAKIISNGDIWMKALDARNKMSHVYNLQVFEDVIKDVHTLYLPILDELHMAMITNARDIDGNK